MREIKKSILEKSKYSPNPLAFLKGADVAVIVW
jgi:hypothetical protein